MRKTLTLLCLCAITAASFGTAPESVSGSYRLVASERTKNFCRRHHIDLPVGRLSLGANRSFRLTYSDDEGVERTSGTYDYDGEVIRFTVAEGYGVGLPREMRVENGRLVDDETEYAQEETYRDVPAPVVREPRRVSSAPAPLPSPRYESARHSGPIDGTWVLVRGKGIDANTKFIFGRDGTFRYSGSNSTSRGTYELTDKGIELSWTEIDGQRVERGANVRKRLPFAYDGEAFFVDDYRYERSR